MVDHFNQRIPFNVQRSIASETSRPSAALIAAALLPFGLGYFFSYLYRAVNAVVAPDLVRDVGLSAAELGLLTSAYLLAFALFQPVLGILLDRFGPRRVQAALVALGALGALLFSFGNGVVVLSLARAIIGMGFAGGLMGAFKAVVIWVPEPRRALANACVMSAGALGVVLSTAPMAWAVSQVGWRHAFLLLSLATFVVAALILLVVPERNVGATQSTPLSQQLSDVGRIFCDPVFLAIAPVIAIPAGSHIALQTLWAGPWFRDVAGLGPAMVGQNLLVMGIAFLVGVLASGVVADFFARRGISLLTVNLGFLAIYLLSQVAIIAAGPLPPVASWSIYAMTGHTGVLAYPWLASYFGAALSGRSNTAMNLLLFGSAFAVQYAVGWVIDLYPQTGGKYDPAAYRMAFGAVLALELVALAWFLVNIRRVREAERSFAHARRWTTGPAS